MYVNLIVSNKKWHRKYLEFLEENTGEEFVFIGNKEEFNLDFLKEVNPRYIFFPHWSYLIPKEIYETYKCIIFHMTDLPFGRGGSPLQNLISRKIYATQLSAIECIDKIDAGPVYLKRPLSLYGTAEEIYLRAAKLTAEIIAEIVKKRIQPVPQQGEHVLFKRRKPEEGNIENLNSLEEIFDYIRMLDAEGYPAAFFENKKFRFEFTRASLKPNCIQADVKIVKKEKDEDEKESNDLSCCCTSR